MEPIYITERDLYFKTEDLPTEIFRMHMHEELQRFLYEMNCPQTHYQMAHVISVLMMRMDVHFKEKTPEIVILRKFAETITGENYD